jgi:hypothetical protein
MEQKDEGEDNWEPIISTWPIPCTIHQRIADIVKMMTPSEGNAQEARVKPAHAMHGCINRPNISTASHLGSNSAGKQIYLARQHQKRTYLTVKDQVSPGASS